MIRLCILATALAVAVPATTVSTGGTRAATTPQAKTVRLSTDRLRDKIKGGWAGQTIGVTFGGPTEFRYRGTMIGDDTPIAWNDTLLKETFEQTPGLYDDIYVDLTFVNVIEKHGADAPAERFADAFAHAGYQLWHANQMARYNLLQGLKPPASGHWTNNPEADDIDFQIEADFIGLMSTQSTVMLWLFVLNLGVAFGAGLYEHRVVMPRWLDTSAPAARWHGDVARRDDVGRRFWVWVTTLPLTLLTVANLIVASQASGAARAWWLAAGVAAAGERLLTFGYFIPVMIRLFGAPDSPATTATATRWASANHLRHALVLGAWLAALQAFALIQRQPV